MKKYLKTGVVFLVVNLVAALIYMRLSSVCYHYLQQAFDSFSSIASLIAQTPFFWVFGAFISFFHGPSLIRLSFENPAFWLKEPITYLISAAVTLVIYLIFRWGGMSVKLRYGLVLVTSLCFNFVFLENFFISMGV